MELVLAVVIGGLYAAAIYMILRRNAVRMIMGLVMLSQATNLLIFTAAGVVRGRPPLIPQGAGVPPMPHADPLPQALILTAIVISFGIFAFALVLVNCAYRRVGTDDLDEMRTEDR